MSDEDLHTFANVGEVFQFILFNTILIIIFFSKVFPETTSPLTLSSLMWLGKSVYVAVKNEQPKYNGIFTNMIGTSSYRVMFEVYNVLLL